MWNRREERPIKPLFLSPPPRKEIQTMLDLIRQADHWGNVGNQDLERELWKLISQQANKYAERAIIKASPEPPAPPPDRIYKNWENITPPPIND